jgi:hypothetical protein
MNTQSISTPWQHWIKDDFLSAECLAELKSVPHHRGQQTPGKRRGDGRFFIDDSVASQYPHLHALWQQLHNGAIKQYFEQHTGLDYTGLHPRVEVISDLGDFYLETHHDLLEKKLTALVYTNHERLWPGTTLGEDYQIESKDNRCMFFVPSTETWHSYPPTHFDVIRRAMQINYWTYSM